MANMRKTWEKNWIQTRIKFISIWNTYIKYLNIKLLFSEWYVYSINLIVPIYGENILFLICMYNLSIRL